MVATVKARHFFDSAHLNVKCHCDEEEWVRHSLPAIYVHHACSTCCIRTSCVQYMYIMCELMFRCGQRKVILYFT